jgi:SAM-dependent methyltransferase
MIILKKFIALNRKYSHHLEKQFPSFFNKPSFKTILLERINTSIDKGDINKVLEVGGIDRPLLHKGHGYIYDGLDIEARENCYEVYDNFFVQSIESPLKEKYDLIISITLLEHVPDNKASFKSIFLSLNPGSETLHYVPSNWHPYSIALRAVGPTIQKLLIPILRPGSEDVTGYPAHFDQCSVSAIKKVLINQGFTDINILPLYRANDYFAFFTPLFIAITAFENLCKKLQLELFSSGFIITAKSPK